MNEVAVGNYVRVVIGCSSGANNYNGGLRVCHLRPPARLLLDLP